ncbi:MULTISPECIES: anthranilate synthase component I [unclassified Roseateles]|uniref:anthranilate synthase component I n=1 Tax=unclassified Roseateles TaxID=2626991 RepID=UPI00161AB5C1|nr:MULTISPECIES: anthranilate synthase component I [unclassified Roseateles]MBB3283402.1 anthranilate synthase component 1 [Mitsuaria sp. BK037]MBB3295447.1 anthranilate synthase component 1 [Mitsuaria sp. BK041]MBB3364663.1 anthranilate synthase component 1 [Mitsuaria sp. BK045]
MITELEFQSLAADGYNRIPLISEAFADLETPLSLYLKLCAGNGPGRHSFLLESVVGGERFGRYSFIGLPARTVLKSEGTVTRVIRDGAVIETHDGDPLAFIEAYQQRFKVALRPGMPRFCGGLAGYFGYDAVRYIEPRLADSTPEGGLPTPDVMLLQCEELAVIDNLSGKLYLIVYADPSQPEAYFKAKKRLTELKDKLGYSVAAPRVVRGQAHPVEREFNKADFLASVDKAKAFIAAGDCMQIVFGQRLKKRYTESPLSLYRALRSLNPSPYMYFYDMGDFQIVGASPEILVRQESTPEGRKVTIRPLAGTRPRGGTPEQDQALEVELKADPKERAEHLMLIDLARNDIGRIARTGSVKVTDAFAVERYSHVMHIVSNVEGLLKDGIGNMDVFRASFPAGTLSGAPKIRAMEIIDQLEPVKRGIYGGACGYLSFGGDMDLAIAIRTGVVMDQVLYVQAAAGIVADSVPELEWKETEAKARALLRAAELVEEGF